MDADGERRYNDVDRWEMTITNIEEGIIEFSVSEISVGGNRSGFTTAPPVVFQAGESASLSTSGDSASTAPPARS